MKASAARRARRLFLERLGDQLERDDADRRFEDENPSRSYWLRNASRAEHKMFAYYATALPKAGEHLVVAVHKGVPGVRIRRYLIVPLPVRLDVGEEIAGAIWRQSMGLEPSAQNPKHRTVH